MGLFAGHGPQFQGRPVNQTVFIAVGRASFASHLSLKRPFASLFIAILASAMAGFPLTAAVYINEVLPNAPGSDTGNEYFELRGTPGMLLTNFYLISLEGQGTGNPGKGDVNQFFDLGTFSLGANGYLFVRQAGSKYPVIAPGGNLIENTVGTGFGQVNASGSTAGHYGDGTQVDLENAATTILLVDVGTGQPPTLTLDLDTNNDGLLDLPAGWTVVDSVGIMDGSGALATDSTYGAINFRVQGQPGGSAYGNIIDVPGPMTTTSGTFYVGRKGESTGSTSNDWVGAVVDGVAGSPLNFYLSSASDSAYLGMLISEMAYGSTNLGTGFFARPPVTILSVLTYNLLGHDATNWSLANPQVQAIGRVLGHLQPDIVGFQEVPETYYSEMAGFLAIYLPGHQFVASSQRLDGAERSGIASRYPITRAQSWLARVSLTNFGYDGVYTRDLLEAQIAVPGFAQPFHFFTTHFKAFNDADSAPRRAAESRAVSNFFATVYLSTNSLHPYVLVGDLNEDYFRPRSFEQGAITNLISAPTGLRLTNPLNPVTNDERTWSSQNANPTIRFDYVLPSGFLVSNIASSQVFRADKINPPAPPLLATDSATSSDHYPVLMTFRNPYDVPFTILSATRSNQTLTLRWQTVFGGRYRVESASGPMGGWTAVVTNLTATTSQLTQAVSAGLAAGFFRVAREQ